MRAVRDVVLARLVQRLRVRAAPIVEVVQLHVVVLPAPHRRAPQHLQGHAQRAARIPVLDLGFKPGEGGYA